MLNWDLLGRKAFESSKRAECETVALADWLEIQAIKAPSRKVSTSSLKTALTAGPWHPPGGRGMPDDTEIESVILDATREISERSTFYAGKGYPFNVAQGGRIIEYSRRIPSVYEVMLAISYINPAPTAGSTDSGGAVFEALAWLGLQRWLGRPLHKDDKLISFVHHLGQPSLSELPYAFNEKINILARLMQDGSGYRMPEHGRSQVQGDGQVDLLAWRGFPDETGGQILVFAGCAAGMNFADPGKYSEVDPDVWVRTNFIEGTLKASRSWARCYFVPRMIPYELGERIKLSAGVIIDRCRLAYLLNGVRHAQIRRAQLWLGETLKLKPAKRAVRAE